MSRIQVSKCPRLGCSTKMLMTGCAKDYAPKSSRSMEEDRTVWHLLNADIDSVSWENEELCIWYMYLYSSVLAT
jgi:hypothetical protein